MITFKALGQHGRLGNSLFQVAATIGHAKRLNTDFLFPDWEYKKYFPLMKFKFNSALLDGQQFKPYQEPCFHYKEIPPKDNLNLIGYFQSEKYFNHCKTDIKNYFLLDEDIINNLSKKYPRLFNTNFSSISIHIRRTDYVLYSNYHTNLLQDGHYERALQLFNTKHFNSSPHVYVFSDDMEFCKEYYKDTDYTFMVGNSPIEDLYLMSKCRNHIIANSSFSWWGAWLSSYPNMVIAPKKWFGPSANHITNDLYCENWILL